MQGKLPITNQRLRLHFEDGNGSSNKLPLIRIKVCTLKVVVFPRFDKQLMCIAALCNKC